MGGRTGTRASSAAAGDGCMGQQGTGSLEHGDSSGEIFWCGYPMPFLTYYYKTFPEEMPKPKGTEDASSPMGDEVNQSEEKVFSACTATMHPDFPQRSSGEHGSSRVDVSRPG